MRYGVIADIHGNLEAFESVINALSGEKIDEYLFVGDIVGYGADPKECIRLVRGLSPKILIAGNHEWGALGLLDLEYFNELAREAIIWTTGLLDRDELDFLNSFRLVYKTERYSLVHGSLYSPERFYYIFDTDDASRTIELMANDICFVGHSHAAGIFYTGAGGVRYTEDRGISMDRGKKYVVNVGSVGQPRDGDPRASFAIYDDADDTVEIRRVEYAVEKAQTKILDAGLPARLAYRLAEGR